MLISLALVGAALADDARLDTPARPTHMAVTLDVDPAEDTFTGRVVLTVDVPEKLAAIPLHAEELEVGTVTLSRGKKTLPATVTRIDDTRISIAGKRPFKPGTWTLTVDYTGPIHTQPYGLYRFEVEGADYLVTQLEADEARTVWPSFDEPGYKVPHQLTVTAPEGQHVVTNGPLLESTPVDGGVRHTFGATPPIPTYAGALAIGPYTKIDIPDVGVPSAIYVPQSMEALVDPAIEALPKAVADNEAWFGSDYPYAKLDLIVAKEFAFGAMENPGAVVMTYAVLPVPGRSTPEEHYVLSEVLNHEVAHMWFGNQVTLAWWDDLWLNESFAQWLGGRMAAKHHPEQRRSVENAVRRHQTLVSEGRATARPLRTDVDPAAVFETANFAVYSKGEALLTAIEAWMGPETFQDGVQNYIQANLGGNATAEVLFAALSEASGKDIGEMLEPYLNRPGGPVVTLSGEPGSGVLRVEQERFLSDGVEMEASEPWPIPLRLRVGRPDGSNEVVTELFTTASAELDIGEWTWIHPLADGIGYYDFRMDDAALERLLAANDVLSVEERITVVQALQADVTAGVRTPAELLPFVKRFQGETDPKVLDEVLDIASYVEVVDWTQDADLMGAADAYRREVLSPFLEQVGMERRDGEPVDAEDLRRNLLAQLGEAGHPEVLAHARSLVDAFFADPTSVPPRQLGWALNTHIDTLEDNSAAARSLHEKLLASADEVDDPRLRSIALSTAASVRVDGIREAMLARSIAADTPRSDTFPLMGGALSSESWEDERGAFAVQWVQDNFAAIGDRMPPQFRIYLASYGTGCSMERHEAQKAFFMAEENRLPGVERVLAEDAEAIGLCTQRRDARLPSVKAFLEARTRQADAQ
jgi:alanyl aminopeptidase